MSVEMAIWRPTKYSTGADEISLSSVNDYLFTAQM